MSGDLSRSRRGPCNVAPVSLILVMVLFTGGWRPAHASDLEPPPATPTDSTARPALPAASAQPNQLPEQPLAVPLSALPTEGIAPTTARLDLQSAPVAEDPPLHHRWWFWTAVGAVTATAVIILVAASRRDSTPPASLLGNQEYKP